MKGYAETEQAFGRGDIVTDGKFRMVVRQVIEDEDGTFWYECTPTDFEAPAREIPQRMLELVG